MNSEKEQMAGTSTVISPNAGNSTGKSTTVQELAGMVHKWTSGAFRGTLGQEKYIDTIFISLMWTESTLRPGEGGAYTVNGTGSAAYKFLYHPKIATLSGQQLLNMVECTRAFGLTQSMGYNHVKGVNPGDLSASTCEIEKHGTGIVDPITLDRLIIKPGDNIVKVHGVSGLSLKDQLTNNYSLVENQVVSGLIILHSKYKNVVFRNGWYYPTIGSVNNTALKFKYKIDAALAAYLGVKGVDAEGTSAGEYVRRITEVNYKLVVGDLSAYTDNDGSTKSSHTGGLSTYRGPDVYNMAPTGCSSA